jgi:uncharacterized protein (DUF488 family)
MKLFTVGYEGLEIEGVLSLLSNLGIETLVDVRELPLSRKRGFSKNALAERLALSGIGYLHMRELGCPRAIRNRYREDRDWSRYTNDFLNYLTTQSSAVSELSERVQRSNCALLCFEADHRMCHRSMVANAVHDLCGAEIEPINSTANANIEPH